MARKSGPSEDDYDNAARLGLLGLTADEDSDVGAIMEQLATLQPRNDTFPAEVLLELAAEAIEESGASPADPVQYEGMRDRYLPEYQFRGKTRQHKSHYALIAAAMIRAGVYPDLLDEAYGWAPTTCGSSPSTPSSSMAGWRLNGLEDRSITSPPHSQSVEA
jgi:hypothetical protein